MMADHLASNTPCFFRRHLIAQACGLCLSSAVIAQTTQSDTGALPDPTDQPGLPSVVITGRSTPTANISGWQHTPDNKAPFQARVIDLENQRDRSFQRLSDITRLDPSVSDAYNSEGYWDYVTVRGFVIDNRINYRRDGLPISAETILPLDNKEHIEILKGASGIQAGTSAPGGLVNLVVKRPTADPLRSVLLAWRETGALLGAIDINQRFGATEAFGLRINAASERLNSALNDQKGHRQLLAVATEWRVNPDSLLEFEWETSSRSQRSQPGFSLLGSPLPATIHPRINLNNQPWALPVITEGQNASLRFSQRINTDWRWTAHAATQQLKTQDRTAFPFGCSAENNYDRYCSDGSFDLYDYRSENERRKLHAIEIAAHGQVQTAGISHQLSLGVLRTSLIQRMQMQAYNYVGSGQIEGTTIVPADPTLTDQNTNRDERSTELFVRDAIKLNSQWTAWLGLRHSHLERDSVRTNGSRATSYTQSITTPWLAASYTLGPQTTVYASWGQGIESEVAPNRARFTNAGQALPALRSRQTELGIKSGNTDFNWGLAYFDIARPIAASVGSDCGTDTPGNTCTRQADGEARHRGLELHASGRHGPWQLQGGLQQLHARRQGSIDANINGKKPTNVPETTLKLQLRYNAPALPGLTALADLITESRRMVLPDNSISIPGTQRIDLGLRYAQTLSGTPNRLVWRAGVSNVFDRRAWREAPFQFDHAYLFPMAPRNFHISLQTDL